MVSKLFALVGQTFKIWSKQQLCQDIFALFKTLYVYLYICDIDLLELSTV